MNREEQGGPLWGKEMVEQNNKDLVKFRVDQLNQHMTRKLTFRDWMRLIIYYSHNWE
jgi:hypothetical protein